MGILLSNFRFNFNAIQTLISRLHGDLCHIRFGDLLFRNGRGLGTWQVVYPCPTLLIPNVDFAALQGILSTTGSMVSFGCTKCCVGLGDGVNALLFKVVAEMFRYSLDIK